MKLLTLIRSVTAYTSTELISLLSSTSSSVASQTHCDSTADYVSTQSYDERFQSTTLLDYLGSPAAGSFKDLSAFAGSENLRLEQLQDEACTLDTLADCAKLPKTSAGQVPMFGGVILTCVFVLLVGVGLIPCVFTRKWRCRPGKVPRRLGPGTRCGVYIGFFVVLVGTLVAMAFSLYLRKGARLGETYANCASQKFAQRVTATSEDAQAVKTLSSKAAEAINELEPVLGISVGDFEVWAGLTARYTNAQRLAMTGSNDHTLIAGLDFVSMDTDNQSIQARTNYLRVLAEASGFLQNSIKVLSETPLEVLGISAYLVNEGLVKHRLLKTWLQDAAIAIVVLSGMSLIGLLFMVVADIPAIQQRRYKDSLDVRPLGSKRALVTWATAAVVGVVGLGIGSAGIVFGYLDAGTCLIAYDFQSTGDLSHLLKDKFSEGAITRWTTIANSCLSMEENADTSTDWLYDYWTVTAADIARTTSEERVIAKTLLDDVKNIQSLIIAEGAGSTLAFVPSEMYTAMQEYAFVYGISKTDYDLMQSDNDLKAPTSTQPEIDFYKLLVGAVPTCEGASVTYTTTNLAGSMLSNMNDAKTLYGWSSSGSSVSVPTLKHAFDNKPSGLSLGVSSCDDLLSKASETALNTATAGVAAPWKKVLNLKWKELTRKYPCGVDGVLTCSYSEYVAELKAAGATLKDASDRWAALAMSWGGAFTLATDLDTTAIDTWVDYLDNTFANTPRAFCSNTIRMLWQDAVRIACPGPVSSYIFLSLTILCMGIAGMLATGIAFILWRRLRDNDDLQRDLRRERRRRREAAAASSQA